MKKLLVSVIDDDRFFRESMRRLMRSLAYTAEAFASAADFLVSPRLAETACVIADVNMPAMNGIELHRHLIEAGRAIPTILVTAYPNDVFGIGFHQFAQTGMLAAPKQRGRVHMRIP